MNTRPPIQVLPWSLWGLLGMVLVVLVACGQTKPSPSASADWALDSAVSSLHFLSTKNGQITETHRFEKLSGAIDAAGRAELTIDLASVQTGIDIRNTRMQSMLFEVQNYPVATAKVVLPPGFLEQLPATGSALLQTELAVDLHGQTQTLPTELRVARVGADRLQVNTPAPVLLAAADFDLLKGVQALTQVAGLSAIQSTVPVTVHLEFRR